MFFCVRPSGFTFVDNDYGTATLSGTPAAGSSGAYTIQINATNGIGSAAFQSFTLAVNAAPSITSAPSTTFAVGATGGFTISASGFPVAALTESGTLPSGVTFVE